MSFFKDFKADFAQAVNELIPDSEEMTSEYEDDDMVNTFDEASNTAAQPGDAAAPMASDGASVDAIPAEDAMDIAPEDLIDNIDDAPGSVQAPAGESADAQMSFDFLSNALGATDGGAASAAAQPDTSGGASMQAGGMNQADASGTPEAGGAQVIDFAKNFAQALQAEQPSADAAAMQNTVNTQAPVETPSPVPDTAATPEAIAQQMGVMPGMEAAMPESVTAEAAAIPENITAEAAAVPENVMAEAAAMPENVTAEAEAAATPENVMAEAAATPENVMAEAAQPELVTPEPDAAAVQADAVPVQAEENTDAMTELPASEEPFNIQNQKEEEAMVKVAEVSEVSESTETFGENDGSTTYITKSTRITGDIETDGALDIIGNVVGNVACKGKLVIGGNVQGNVRANEVYANAARIEGDVICEGSAKIGVGSVIIGKVEGASAVIAGAVNGDIDVQGPVIVDSTAVIMGNIKSKSVQINNGAVIEGFCSQSYSEIDVKSFFA